MAQYRNCARCGGRFEYKRFDHWFCSGACCAAYYREHDNPTYIHAELPHDKPHVCEECGTPYDVNAYAERGGKRAPKYCSPKCKQKAYRDRGKATQEQAQRRYEAPHREAPHREAPQYEAPYCPFGASPNWRISYDNAMRLMGLSGGWTRGQLKTSYRTLMKQYHPDLCKEPWSTRMAQNINAAFNYLLRHC